MKNTIEGNRLIAKFMGLKPLEGKNILFHIDWNRLMEVIERIKYIEDNQEEFFGEDYYIIHLEIDLLNGVEFKIDKKRFFGQSAFGEGQLIDAVWNSVVEFIKWFNKVKR